MVCWVRCVLQDAAGLSEATEPVELLQRVKNTAHDLLGCVYGLWSADLSIAVQLVNHTEMQ